MSHREQQEACRDMVAEPARQRRHESAMAAFVAGLAYEEQQRDDEEADAEDEKGKQHKQR